MAATENTAKNWLKPTIITTVVASLLMLVANTSYWVNNYIFDAHNFTQLATTSLTSESSRQALAQYITDEALANRPIAKKLAGNTLENVVAGILGSNQVSQVLTKTVNKAHVYVTSSSQESVVINLEGVKDIIGQILDQLLSQLHAAGLVA